MKIKIGTQLEEELFRELKVAAAREKKPLSEVIQSAVLHYLRQQRQPSPVKNGLQRFLEKPPVAISDEAFKQIMEADYYDQ